MQAGTNQLAGIYVSATRLMAAFLVCCCQVDYAKAALFLNISSQPSEALPWWSHPELKVHKGLDPRTQARLRPSSITVYFNITS